MAALVWGLLVLVVFPLLQMPVLLYIAKRFESDSEPVHPARRYWSEPVGDGPIRSFEFESESGSESPSEYEYDSNGGTSIGNEGSSLIACPHCETENDPAFTYCRSCVEKLPPPRLR